MGKGVGRGLGGLPRAPPWVRVRGWVFAVGSRIQLWLHFPFIPAAFIGMLWDGRAVPRRVPGTFWCFWGGNGGNGGLGEMGAWGKCKGMGSSSRLPQSPRADVSIDPGLPTPLSLLKISRSLVCQRCWTRCQPRAINTRLLFPSEVFLLPSHRPGSLPGQAEHHRAEGKITAHVPAGPVPAPGDTRRPSSPVLPWLPALLAEKKSNKQAAALAALRKSTGASGFGT